VEKTYDAPGVYNVTLIVTDDQGVQSQPATHQINIVAQAVQPTLEPTEEPVPEVTDTPEPEGEAPSAVIGVSTDGETQLPIAGPVPAQVDQALFFNGNDSQPGDSPIASYDWDFGDGQTATGEQATHAFAAPGSYIVSLTVTDENGLTDTVPQEVQVAEAQP
jgi:PKD repeat protein